MSEIHETYGKDFIDLFIGLAMPFAPEEIRTRSQAGRSFSYVTARTVQNRLDDVLGPANWWCEFDPREHSVTCKLSVRLPDGRTITKSDAGGYAGMADQGDDDKSGFSDSFKRAAVMLGVGRFLYGDGVPNFAKSAFPVNGPRSPARQSSPPAAQYSAPAAPAPPRANGTPPSASNGNGSPPRNGRALFAWTKKQEEEGEEGLLKYLNGWAKQVNFGDRMVDWAEDQVAQAYDEANRKIKEVHDSDNGHSEPAAQPAAARPNPPARPSAPARPSSPRSAPAYDTSNPPETGRDMWKWCVKQRDNGFKSIVDDVNAIADDMGVKGKMIDWSEADVARVYSDVAGTANHAVGAASGNGHAPLPPGVPGGPDDPPF